MSQWIFFTKKNIDDYPGSHILSNTIVIIIYVNDR